MPSNRIHPWFVNGVFIAATVVCLLPFLLLIMASLTNDETLIRQGYALIPDRISFDAYSYVFSRSSEIMRAYGITILVTLLGTSVGLFISALIAYPLSRQGLPLRNLIGFIVFFSMLFNGGLVSTYLVYTQLFDLKNTLLALIVPGLLTNGFIIFMIRTFFSFSVPMPIIESAYIDGASEMRIFLRIVVPLSLPVLSTAGLTMLIFYWNDWNNGLLYLTDPKLYSMQNLLNRMLSDAQFLQQNSLGGYSSSIQEKIPLESVRMAMGVIGFLPIAIAYPFFQKYLVGGLATGAVKG